MSESNLKEVPKKDEEEFNIKSSTIVRVMLSLFCGNELDKYDVINYLLEQAGKCKLKFDIHEAVIDFKPGDTTIFHKNFYRIPAEESFDLGNLPSAFVFAFSAKSYTSWKYVESICNVIDNCEGEKEFYKYVPRIAVCLDSNIWRDMSYLRRRWLLQYCKEKPECSCSLPLPWEIEESREKLNLMDIIYFPCMPVYNIDMFENWTLPNKESVKDKTPWKTPFFRNFFNVQKTKRIKEIVGTRNRSYYGFYAQELGFSTYDGLCDRYGRKDPFPSPVFVESFKDRKRPQIFVDEKGDTVRRPDLDWMLNGNVEEDDKELLKEEKLKIEDIIEADNGEPLENTDIVGESRTLSVRSSLRPSFTTLYVYPPPTYSDSRHDYGHASDRKLFEMKSHYTNKSYKPSRGFVSEKGKNFYNKYLTGAFNQMIRIGYLFQERKKLADSFFTRRVTNPSDVDLQIIYNQKVPVSLDCTDLRFNGLSSFPYPSQFKVNPLIGTGFYDLLNSRDFKKANEKHQSFYTKMNSVIKTSTSNSFTHYEFELTNEDKENIQGSVYTIYPLYVFATNEKYKKEMENYIKQSNKMNNKFKKDEKLFLEAVKDRNSYIDDEIKKGKKEKDLNVLSHKSYNTSIQAAQEELDRLKSIKKRSEEDNSLLDNVSKTDDSEEDKSKSSSSKSDKKKSRKSKYVEMESGNAGNKKGSRIKSYVSFAARQLDLSFNLIRNFPYKCLCYNHITVLNLSHNFLSSLSDGILDFTSLLKLDLSNNRFEEFNYPLPCSLVSLDLSGNLLSNLFEGGKGNNSYTRWNSNILKTIKNINLKNIKELDLSCNKIEKIPKSIKSMSSLMWLELSGNDIDSFSLDELPEHQLSYFGIANNLLSCNVDVGVDRVSIFSCYGNSTFTLGKFTPVLRHENEVDLSGLKIKDISLLFTINDRINNIVTLDLSNCGLNEVEGFQKPFSLLPNLDQLILRLNGFKKVPDLKSLNKLTRLDLSCNRISNPSYDKLPSSLTHLSLEDNMMLLFPQFPDNLPNLKYLSLVHNDLDSFQCENDFFRKLYFLDLSDNDFDKVDCDSDSDDEAETRIRIDKTPLQKYMVGVFEGRLDFLKQLNVRQVPLEETPTQMVLKTARSIYKEKEKGGKKSGKGKDDDKDSSMEEVSEDSYSQEENEEEDGKKDRNKDKEEKYKPSSSSSSSSSFEYCNEQSVRKKKYEEMMNLSIDDWLEKIKEFNKENKKDLKGDGIIKKNKNWTDKKQKKFEELLRGRFLQLKVTDYRGV